VSIAKANKIKLIIFDVDGVLTDGRIYHSAKGDEMKAFHVHDGLGIKLLQKAGLETAIITGRQSSLVDIRAKELNINHVYQGQHHKQAAYKTLLEKLNLTPAQTAYIGDDFPDLILIKTSGFGVAVQNAVYEIKQCADYITTQQGGNGAIREVAEYILKAQQVWTQLVESY